MRTWRPWMVMVLSILLLGFGLFLSPRAGALPMPGINGDVYDSANNQMIGAVVRVYKNGVQVDQQTTIGSGHFMFTTGTVTEGLHKVTAEAPGFITAEQWVTVQFGSSEPIVFTLAPQSPPAGSLEITVQDDGGSPISGATIGIYSLTDELLVSALSDAGGKFTFHGLEAGTAYTVYATKTGYTGSPMTSPAVTAGTTQSMTVTLTPETPPGSITVRLTNYADGTALTGPEVRLDNEANGHPVATDGTYTFTGVADGQHTVTVTYATNPNALFSVTVAAGQPATLNAGLWYSAWVQEMDGTVAQATTLPGTRLVNGDLCIEADLNLNGQTLWVNGSVHHGSGTLSFGGGRLEATGEYRMQAWQGSDWGASTGRLIMTNPLDYLKVGSHMIVQSNQSMSTTPALTNGTIELGGSFTQAGWPDNFSALASHTTRLSGSFDAFQDVNFENPGPSHFGRLEIANQGNVRFLQEVNAAGEIRGGFLGPVRIRAANLAGQTPLTLYQDLEVEPLDGTTAVELTGASVDLNGRRLVVRGDLNQTGGQLRINKGALLVERSGPASPTSGGNYTLTSTAATDGLIMQSDADLFQTRGSVTIQSKQDTIANDFLTAGVMIVEGDFTQKIADTWGGNFNARGTHKVILRGPNPQAVTFESPGPNGSVFNELDIRTHEPVRFAGGINAGKLTGESHLRVKAGVLTRETDLVLAQDMIVLPDSGSDAVMIEGARVRLNGYRLIIGERNMPAHLIQSGGALEIENGILDVTGDYRLETPGATVGDSDGQLFMQDPEGLLLVRGNFVTRSRSSAAVTPHLSAGTMEVQRNFTQQSATVTDNFKATGAHIVRLAGWQPQQVSFGSYPDSGFANLVQYNCAPGAITYAPTDVGQNAVNACNAQVAVTAVNGGAHRNGNITLVFNRRFRSQEPDYSRVTLTTDGAPVPFRLYTDGTWMHLEPRQSLKPGAAFVVTVPKDLVAGDPMAADFTFTFSTAPAAGSRITLQGLWVTGTPVPVGDSMDQGPNGDLLFSGHRLTFLKPDGTFATSPADLQGIAPDSRMAVIREAVATAGFLPGDVYLSSGIPGKIARWQPDHTFTAEWASLPPPATGNIAALTWDRFGSWGNALIALTSTGEIWTFDSNGGATQHSVSVAGTPTAAATVAGDPAYGDLAGRLLVGTFDGKVYAVQGSTAALVHDFGYAISDLELIPAGENLFGVDRGQGNVTAPASAFSDYAGGILVALERPGRLLTLRHTATGFEILQIGESLWWSDLTFSPMAAPPRPVNPAWLGGSARAQYRQDSLGIEVTLKQGATVVATIPTDSSGRFDFQNLADGTYLLEARRAGHLIRSITIVIAGGEVVAPFYPISLWLHYGDLNGDGAITRADAHMLDSFYYTTWAHAVDPEWFATLDIDNNQVIDISEYVLLLLNATE